MCQVTVKEQLVYEIADPGAYLSPDVTVSLLSLQLDDVGENRVRIRGARGCPAPSTYKVSATYQDGFRAQGQLTIFGTDAVEKARRAGQAVLSRLTAGGVSLREAVVECLGAGACRPQGIDPALAQPLTETVLRIAVADASREAIEQFVRELMPLVTAGPPGTTGYAEGRPRIHPLFRFWPCLIERDRVSPHMEVLPATGAAVGQAANLAGGHENVADRALLGGQLHCHPSSDSTTVAPTSRIELQGKRPSPPRRLGDIAHGRSGDKGINANIGLIARRREDFPRLLREATPRRVASYFGMAEASQITRYELPNLDALNLVIHNILASPLRLDAQGKALAQVLLEMPLQDAE